MTIEPRGFPIVVPDPAPLGKRHALSADIPCETACGLRCGTWVVVLGGPIDCERCREFEPARVTFD